MSVEVKRVSCHAVASISHGNEYLLTHTPEGLMPINAPVGTTRQQSAEIIHRFGRGEQDGALSFAIIGQMLIPAFADWFRSRKGRDTSIKSHVTNVFREGRDPLDNVRVREKFLGFNTLTFRNGGAHSHLTTYFFDVFEVSLGREAMDTLRWRAQSSKSPWCFVAKGDLTNKTHRGEKIHPFVGALLKPRQSFMH